MVAPVSLAADQSSSRSFLKFTLLLIFVFNHEIQDRLETYRQYFQRDLIFCKDCFQHQIPYCENFFNNIEYDISSNPLQNAVNLILKNDKRATDLLTYKSKHNQASKIIAKYITNHSLRSLSSLSVTPAVNITFFKQKFFDAQRLDGLQFCAPERIDRFVKYLSYHRKVNFTSVWLYLMLNIEPLLMPHLEAIGFPVPMHFTVCGFTLYQAQSGKALINYFESDFQLKLRIAKQLLEAAIQFSSGFDGFRIYITDLNPDNLVFDELKQKLYFVDLDTVLIVDSDSKQLKSNSNVHKYIYIDCDNCFAYSQQDICSYGLSDINLFCACQLLRENLNREPESGFLYPIPNGILKTYSNFQNMLDKCVDCSDIECKDRFAATLDLIQLFNVILVNFY